MTGFGHTRVELRITCNVCGKEQAPIMISHYQLKSWLAGAKIQDAMPELNVVERELLISATCGPCWDEMWKEDDE